MATNKNTNGSSSQDSNRPRSWSAFSPNSNPYPLPLPSDPPPYRPLESTTATTDPAHPPAYSTPSSHTTIPANGLQIPSRADNFTSGFAYPPFLQSYGITPTHWTQFTSELALPVKLSRGQWATTVAKGLGTLAVGATMAGVLGAVPAVLVARKAKRNREEMNFIVAANEEGGENGDSDGDGHEIGEGRYQKDGDSKTGALTRTLRTWNETFFEPRGLRVNVQGPWEGLEEMEEMEVSRAGGKNRVEEKKVREDAARKARIIIVPVDV